MRELTRSEYRSIGDIHKDDECGFRDACEYGHLDVVKFLTISSELKAAGYDWVDIHVNKDQGFEWACEYEHWPMMRWLVLERNIEVTPHIKKIIKEYPQAQEIFRIREEQEKLTEAMGVQQKERVEEGRRWR